MQVESKLEAVTTYSDAIKTRASAIVAGANSIWQDLWCWPLIKHIDQHIFGNWKLKLKATFSYKKSLNPQTSSRIQTTSMNAIILYSILNLCSLNVKWSLRFLTCLAYANFVLSFKYYPARICWSIFSIWWITSEEKVNPSASAMVQALDMISTALSAPLIEWQEFTPKKKEMSARSKPTWSMGRSNTLYARFWKVLKPRRSSPRISTPCASTRS